MPLDRAHVTPAARIMVPLCVVFFAVVGTSFAASAPTRLLASPMLRYAGTLMPIQIWGAAFVACSLIMAAAMAARSRFWYRYGLLTCVMAMVVWTLVAIVGAFVEPVSYSAWAWPAFIGGACYATFKSLEDEHGRRGN